MTAKEQFVKYIRIFIRQLRVNSVSSQLLTAPIIAVIISGGKPFQLVCFSQSFIMC